MEVLPVYGPLSIENLFGTKFSNFGVQSSCFNIGVNLYPLWDEPINLLLAGRFVFDIIGVGYLWVYNIVLGSFRFKFSSLIQPYALI